MCVCMFVHIYIHIYICVCVCECVCGCWVRDTWSEYEPFSARRNKEHQRSNSNTSHSYIPVWKERLAEGDCSIVKSAPFRCSMVSVKSPHKA
jgi:hypothetical protein